MLLLSALWAVPLALLISVRSIIGLMVSLLIVWLCVYVGKMIFTEHGRVVEVIGLVIALLILLDFLFGFVIF